MTGRARFRPLKKRGRLGQSFLGLESKSCGVENKTNRTGSPLLGTPRPGGVQSKRENNTHGEHRGKGGRRGKGRDRKKKGEEFLLTRSKKGGRGEGGGCVEKACGKERDGRS